MPAPSSMSKATLETRPPVLFGPGAVLVICLYGLVLAVPFLLSLVLVSFFKLGWLTVLVPLAVLAYSALFLPVGFGNSWVTRRILPLRPAQAREEDLFVVQLTLSPRLRGGARALVEDADDFGWLWFGPAGLEYRGDAVTFSLPYAQAVALRRRGIGWRGFFLYGGRMEVVVAEVPGLNRVELAERSSRLLPASRATSRRLYERLKQSVGTLPA